MKALVKTLIVIAVIIILLLIVSLFLPGKMHVERSVSIKAPVEMVYEQVSVLKNWENWSPWHKMDKNMKFLYSGPASGEKAKYSWDSQNKQLGKGYLEIKECAINQYIIMDMSFTENGTATGKFLFTPDTTGVTVVWSMESDLKNNPVSKYFGLLMDKMVGSDFIKGLNEIKRITEEEYALQLKYKIEEITTGSFHAVVTHLNCKQNEIGAKMGEGFGLLMKAIMEKNISPAGAPFAIYHSFDTLTGVDFELGFPVTKCRKISVKNVECKSFSSFKAIRTNYAGDYSGTCEAYGIMDQWLKKNNRTIAGPPWEIYLTDPQQEKDTSKWLTTIMYPVN